MLLIGDLVCEPDPEVRVTEPGSLEPHLGPHNAFIMDLCPPPPIASLL